MKKESSSLSGLSAMIINEKYLQMTVSRSSGPGGQNVNKVNTRVTLFFDLAHYPHFTDEQKTRIRRALATRTDKDDVIRVSSQRFRTQRANRVAAAKRLTELIEKALYRPPVRRATNPTRASQQRRLDSKKQRGRIKAQRRLGAIDDQ